MQTITFGASAVTLRRVVYRIEGQNAEGKEWSHGGFLDYFRAHVLWCRLAIAAHKIADAHRAEDPAARFIAEAFEGSAEEIDEHLRDFLPNVTDRDDTLPLEDSEDADRDSMFLWLEDAPEPFCLTVTDALVIIGALKRVLDEHDRDISDTIEGGDGWIDPPPSGLF